MFRLFASAVIRQDFVSLKRVKWEGPLLTNSRDRVIIKLLLFGGRDLHVFTPFMNLMMAEVNSRIL